MIGRFLSATKAILPGLVVCVIIAVAAQTAAQFVPAVGSALIAIALGIIAGNTFLGQPVLDKGTKFSESKLLEISIVLTGLTLHLTDIIGVGLGGVGFILIQMTGTIVAACLIGKLLGFGRRFSLLMSAGNAVCGSSAIGTIAPVVNADSKEKGISITIVNVTGTILMVLLPILAGILYHHETLHTSGLIGGTLQSIGQVIASAKFVNDDVVEMATVFKIIRIVFLVLVALVFSKINTDDTKPFFSARQETGVRVKTGIPWFIIGFFLLSVVTSFGIVPQMVSHGAKLVSNQFEIIALAAIGMRVKFRDLVREGPKAMLYGGMVGCCQIALAVTLIFLLF